MKKLIMSAAAFALTIGMVPVHAQDGPPQFRPVEVWACSFNDGMDQDDLDDVYEDIVEAAGDTAYAAFQLNPFFTGTFGQNIDLIYIGAWADGSVMGADMAGYVGGDDYGWDDTVDCQSFMYASNWIQEGGTPNEAGTFMMAISDCNVDHGNTPAQAVGALSRYNDYRVANGLTVATLVWFPVYGGGNAEFDFKVANVFDGPQAMGDAFKWSVDNAAYNASSAMMQGVVDCDEARVYSGRTIMNNLQPAN